MKLRNYMELAVDHVMPNMFRAFPTICVCDDCRLDMKAIALNHLKPYYVVTDEGETWTKVSEMLVQFEVDIMKALIDAIAIVSKQPRHPQSETITIKEWNARL